MKNFLAPLLFVLVLSAEAAFAAPKTAPTTKRLNAAEVDRAAREAIAATPPRLPKGATITAIRCTVAPEVPAAPARITIDLTPAPRKSGTVSTTAVLGFWKDDASIAARVPVTVDLAVPASALVADAPKGSAVTLVVSRGLVEISTPAVTSADADVGDVVQVLLRPSGRAIRAKLVAKDRALAIEEGS